MEISTTADTEIMTIAKKTQAAVFFAVLVFSASVFAGNTPCSGKKGGVSHCSNGKFICKDGSTSASKKICTGK